MLLLLACASPDPVPHALTDAFTSASDEHGVPRDLLVATAWAISRFDQREGAVNREGGIGLFNLREGAAFPSLDTAAVAIGAEPDALVDDPSANIHGAAALLAAEARVWQDRTGEPVDTLREWYPIVAAWAGTEEPVVAEGFAAQVYDLVQFGFVGEAPSGEVLEVEPTRMEWRRLAIGGSSLVEHFVPACADNYSNYSRTRVDKVVIHTMEGSYSGSISWFQNCSSSVSAHYSVRSSDGEITQSVDEADVAWHAGHWSTNEASIGIEHEGYVSDPGRWYTDAMYRSSAALVSDICDRYGIPKDRAHVIGHNEVPGCSSPGGGGSGCHTDPGSGWNWDYFMSLVTGSGSGSESMGSDAVAPGPLVGRFDGTIESVRYAESDTCSGALTGAVTGSQVYLTGTCTLDHHPDKSERVTWSGTIVSGVVDGRMTVEGYSVPFRGSVNADGGVSASFHAETEIGGDVGFVKVDVNLAVAPG